jgi:predicted helicase
LAKLSLPSFFQILEDTLSKKPCGDFDVEGFKENINALKAKLIPVKEGVEKLIADLLAGSYHSKSSKNQGYPSSPPFQKHFRNFLEICREALHPQLKAEDAQEMLIQYLLIESLIPSPQKTDKSINQDPLSKGLMLMSEIIAHSNYNPHNANTLKDDYQHILKQLQHIPDYLQSDLVFWLIGELFQGAYPKKVHNYVNSISAISPANLSFVWKSIQDLLQKFSKSSLQDEEVNLLMLFSGGIQPFQSLEPILTSKKNIKSIQSRIFQYEPSLLKYLLWRGLRIGGAVHTQLKWHNPLQDSKKARLGAFQQGLFDRTNPLPDQQEFKVILGNLNDDSLNLNFKESKGLYKWTDIDERIHETYFSESTKVYSHHDHALRYFRWASDHLKSGGILVFWLPKDFIEERNWAGFRRYVCLEFEEIYILNFSNS